MTPSKRPCGCMEGIREHPSVFPAIGQSPAGGPRGLAHFQKRKPLRHEILRQTRWQVVAPAHIVVAQ
jgi:hypothetical protein